MRPLGRQIYYLIGVSVVVMLIAGAMLVMPALADEGPASNSSHSPSGQTREQNAKAAYQDFITKLAANLGINDTAKVNSGVKSALSQMVDERQQNGTLSQAQADRLKQRINAEEFPGGFPGMMGGHHGPGMIGKRFFDMDELANFFGESATDLKTELQQGNSLTTIAQQHGKSRDELKKFLTDQFNARAAQNESTAQQRFQDHLDELIDRAWPIKQSGPSPSATT
ncbi:conserved exported hypothetical protein [Nitrolancea hollandica Lb]|uniref:Uncharacterized protein n=1 Tax=Nitrolancea hollandica Lb TaxID=1129897 RepID=I4ENF0_9BACT|nr:conserved exported hypothetical protein [Nitrolancea hollandica Lb]